MEPLIQRNTLIEVLILFFLVILTLVKTLNYCKSKTWLIWAKMSDFELTVPDLLLLIMIYFPALDIFFVKLLDYFYLI